MKLVPINNPQDALVSIILFLVGVIFGVGIIYQKISDHTRRLKFLEDQIAKPVVESTAVILLTSELSHLKSDFARIETSFAELNSTIKDHYRNIEILFRTTPGFHLPLRERERETGKER